MAPGSFRFERFLLDHRNRQLRRDGEAVELNGRYLDALALLVSEPGALVSKDRFMDEVWRGVPVTDEALTQCIRTLRKQLGDDAASPRFIETVPRHGYRFIAPVERVAEATALPALQSYDWGVLLRLGAAGMAGGGLAGALGGLFYGLATLQDGMGAVSVLFVFISLTILVGVIGGAGVGFGIAASRGRAGWCVAGGAVGGMLVGAVVKLVGLDAFNLLFGRSPGDVTGAPEGLLLGGAVGLGLWLASRWSLSLRQSVAVAGLIAGSTGVIIVLTGGRLMGGSLDLLARNFPDSRLRLDEVGALFRENGFGPVSQIVTAGLEGLLFGACVAGAMILARRSLRA